MKWPDEYNIGIEKVDSQHRKLFRMLVQLKQSFAKDEDSAKALRFLVDYTKEHFSSEEALMQEIDYPEYEAHRKIHQRLIDQVTDILTGLKSGDRLDPPSLIRFLTDWLLTHIGEEDRQIGVFMQKKG